MCQCYFSLNFNANVYNCSSMNVKSLPPSVPHGTDWLVMENNHGGIVADEHGTHNYLCNITYLDLRNNSIRDLADGFWERLHNASCRLNWLNLADNNLVRIPRRIKEASNLQKLWLAGNPIHCSCEMTWMIGWLKNFTTPSGERVVVDFREITCDRGSMMGRPVYTLNEIDMGCYPNTWALWQKVVVGAVFTTLVVVIVALVVIVIKQSRKMKNFPFENLTTDSDSDNYDQE